MKKALSILTGIFVVALAASAGWFLTRRPAASRSVSGTIEMDEVHIASRHGGRVRKIFAREGDGLRSGQLVIELEAGELDAQRAHAAATLAELESGPRPEEIQAAKLEWESIKAEYEFARAEEGRTLGLFESSAISKTERDRATSRAQVLEKSVAAAKSRHELLVAGTRVERITQARAQLAEIDARLAEMRITAPADSVLEVLLVKVGDVLAPNREAATLVLPQTLWVRVYVPESWLGFIKLQEPVRLRVDSFPDRDFQGEVEQINRAAEFTPRNAQTIEERIKQVIGVKIKLLDAPDSIRAGMAADVFFPRVQR